MEGNIRIGVVESPHVINMEWASLLEIQWQQLKKRFTVPRWNEPCLEEGCRSGQNVYFEPGREEWETMWVDNDVNRKKETTHSNVEKTTTYREIVVPNINLFYFIAFHMLFNHNNFGNVDGVIHSTEPMLCHCFQS